MTDVEKLIVRVLGVSDAVVLPIRKWEGHVSANRGAALTMFSTHGVPIRVGGDDATRKTGERLLSEAVTAGLLTVRRHGRARHPFARLTESGEKRARILCGLPGREVGRLILGAVADRTSRAPRTLDEMWCDEVDLNDGRGWGEDATAEDRRRLSLIELDFCAAAFPGWLSAHSTTENHVRYRVEPAGWAEIDNPSGSTKVPRSAKESQGAYAVYAVERDSKLRELEVSTPETTGDIGELPLPVSHEGMELREPVNVAVVGETEGDTSSILADNNEVQA